MKCYLKRIPSEAIAYNILGKGNMTPSKLVDRPNRAPTLTIFPAQGIPARVKAAGSGASGSNK